MKTVFIDGLDYDRHLSFMPFLSTLNPIKRPSRWGYENFMGEDRRAKFYFTNNSSWRWIEKYLWLPRIAIEILLNLQMLYQRRPFFRIYNFKKETLPYMDTNIKRRKFYKKFMKMDRMMHTNGLSGDVVRYLEKVDRWLELNRKDYDEIISDHGFRKVEKLIDSKHYVKDVLHYFIDQNEIRIWHCQKETYGDEIIPCKPGETFCPSSWNINPARGVHGFGSEDGKENGVYWSRTLPKRYRI